MAPLGSPEFPRGVSQSLTVPDAAMRKCACKLLIFREAKPRVSGLIDLTAVWGLVFGIAQGHGKEPSANPRPPVKSRVGSHAPPAERGPPLRVWLVEGTLVGGVLESRRELDRTTAGACELSLRRRRSRRAVILIWRWVTCDGRARVTEGGVDDGTAGPAVVTGFPWGAAAFPRAPCHRARSHRGATHRVGSFLGSEAVLSRP